MVFFVKKPDFDQNAALAKPSSVMASDLITWFDQCFVETWNTRLVGGASEPEYLPASASCPYHRIIFTQDYVSSALHEIAHWCVAGDQRRRQRDYGYWYVPDGRNAQQQTQFEQVEVRPQAMEWVFSHACGVPFRISADNLGSDLGPSQVFKARIVAQAQDYCRLGLNGRAQRWIDALMQATGQPNPLNPGQYSMALLES